jgi:hypothetical protein
MKRQVLLIGVGAIATWIVSAQWTILLEKGVASAEPAPLFRPLIDDIRNQLPPGLEMRLPANLPPSNIELYPYIESDSTGFRVNLAFKPNCSSPSCTFGGLGVFTEDGSKVWPPKGDNIIAVDLGNGIRGYYLTRGPEDNRLRYVFWEQDGLKYAIGAQAFAITQKELIEVATSMVKEPAITTIQPR